MDQIVCGIRRHCDAGFFRTSSAEMEQKNMEQYATQMEAARKGIVTEELKKVAAKERMTTEELMPLVAEGKVVICANRHHKCIDPEGVGSMLRTKINVNLGISRDCKDYDVEMEKVMAAVDMGAHAIMDLSSHGNTIPFRRKLTAECPAMIGTVPVYDSVIHYQRDLATLTAKDFIDVVRLHAEDGVDFVVRVEREELGRKLLVGVDVYAMCFVGNASFLQHDGHLDAVRCGQGVQLQPVRKLGGPFAGDGMCVLMLHTCASDLKKTSLRSPFRAMQEDVFILLGKAEPGLSPAQRLRVRGACRLCSRWPRSVPARSP